MTNTELISELTAAAHTNDSAKLFQLVNLAKETPEPVLNLHYIEALFWIRNKDLNRARMALHNELRHFPHNQNAAKLFIILQPASRNSFGNESFGKFIASIEYVQDEL